jgi:hypothetical protein
VATGGINLTTRTKVDKARTMAMVAMAAEGTRGIPTSSAHIINEMVTPSSNAEMQRKKRTETTAARTGNGTVATMDLGRVDPSLLINLVLHFLLILRPSM